MDPKLSVRQHLVHIWDDGSYFVILDLRMMLLKCESRIHALALIYAFVVQDGLGHRSQTLGETATSYCLG